MFFIFNKTELSVNRKDEPALTLVELTWENPAIYLLALQHLDKQLYINWKFFITHSSWKTKIKIKNSDLRKTKVNKNGFPKIGFTKKYKIFFDRWQVFQIRKNPSSDFHPAIAPNFVQILL